MFSHSKNNKYLHIISTINYNNCVYEGITQQNRKEIFGINIYDSGICYIGLINRK